MTPAFIFFEQNQKKVKNFRHCLIDIKNNKSILDGSVLYR